MSLLKKKNNQFFFFLKNDHNLNALFWTIVHIPNYFSFFFSKNIYSGFELQIPKQKYLCFFSIAFEKISQFMSKMSILNV